ncbi:plasmid replication protein, CyRepA1 family [Coleofasciculus sp. FACHB-501]|uniref:plasmid replication protein, CyRepA1 family n=1 Tax=Cyanophyceae TaxID=3028117 RepID=UPI0016853F67|nr:plasmid replication protein, CyRepA1 family [Coleofasciculus sp. FACHB-501]MBD1838888.1 DUF3854 domain-containing protein [Coleofasciculus sp. FACHB-501]
MIHSQHFKEWQSSGVDNSIVKLNVRSLSGDSPYGYLLYSRDIPRRNDGRIRDKILNRYRHLEQGGWWCDGLDPLADWEPMLWGCFKPDKSKRDADGKNIKYEHPYRTPTRAFFLRVPLHIWQMVSVRCQVPMPETVEITPDGEAVGFWQWVLEKQVPLTIVEGVKKAACLLSTGEVAIALPGVSMGFRSPKDEMGNLIANSYLIPELALFATPGRKITICFDQDSKPKTIATVRAMIAKMGGLFARSGCIVRVIEWDNQLGKGVDDLIVNHGVETFYAAYDQAMSLEKWQARQYFNLTYTPNERVNRRYLGELEIPVDAKLIAIKSLRGTGKTESLGGIAQKSIYQGKRVLVLTHRQQLGVELCNRFGINYVSELRDSETRGLLGFGLCVDSLHPKSQARFNAEEWKNCLIIIDEVEQVLGHLLNSSTCTSTRVSILKSLKTLIQQNLSSESEGQVIVSDADLSDLSIDYIKALAGFSVEPFIVVNDWKPEDGGWMCHQYGGKNPSELWASLESDIEEGGKPFVCLSAQKEKSKWGTINLEARLIARFPDLRILRIDAETVADPTHAAYQCVGNLNEILPMYDCVLASPSIETGVSIVLKGHFTGVWGIFQGVTAPNSALQALARVREAVPRHFWAASRGMNGCFIGNGSTSIKSLLSSQHKTTKSNISLLQRADFEAITDADTNFQSESLVTWAKLAVRHNAAILNYRENIVTGLQAEGHTIVEGAVADNSYAIKEEIEINRDTNYQAECSAIAGADNISDAEYEKLKDKLTKTKSERRTERKHALKSRYATAEVTSALIEIDDEGLYPQLRLQYFLTLGREFLPGRDKKTAAAALENGEGALWKPDFNRNQLGAKVDALDKLGVTQLLQTEGRELRSSDEDLEAIASTVIDQRWAVKTVLNVSISQKDSSIVVLRKLLSCLGVSLELLGRDGTGQRERYYTIAASSEHVKILRAWLQRDRELASTAASTAGNKEVINKPLVDETPVDAPNFSDEEVRNAADMLLNCDNSEAVEAVLDAISGFYHWAKHAIWALIPREREIELRQLAGEASP